MSNVTRKNIILCFILLSFFIGKGKLEKIYIL
jgi:hypothetical protein